MTDDNTFNQQLGAIMRAVRKHKKLTQEQVAHQLGVSKMTVSHWERGDRAILAKDLKRFCEVVGVNISLVFDEMEE